MFDILQEIYSTIKKNRLRTFLTGFAIAWGIFMLILLLGMGNGLKNGVKSNFGSSANNSVFLWPGMTSIPYHGLRKGRDIDFGDKDISVLQKEFPFISTVSVLYRCGNVTVSAGKEYSTNNMSGVTSDYAEIENITVSAGNGRFINDADVRESRKVIIIHKKTAETLFRDGKALGKYVTIDKVAYRVVGIYEADDNERQPGLFVPLSTVKQIYNPEHGYDRLAFMVDGLTTTEDNEKFEKDMRATLGGVHNFSPEDTHAVWVWNKIQQYTQTMGIFGGIDFFIWIIGIGTLIAGIVGVSNIMLITVRERTREFGIRKALGAKPYSILKLIIIESLLITSFFGYIGMLLGIGIVELVNNILSVGEGEMSMFRNPEVNIPIVVAATLVLIISGILAGYFPARKAVQVKPIEALRYE